MRMTDLPPDSLKIVRSGRGYRAVTWWAKFQQERIVIKLRKNFELKLIHHVR